ncbi:PH domain-containing protein [Terrabacter sp. C0L_2]|uniref:PH domain-containing protein n=1 Tax=Terrabacter sp. C0L_2 TaxID=3108389 RepID=UPI002ED47051|nr:PH domain-containing protein [Terrabacter sp. C0L_2]
MTDGWRRLDARMLLVHPLETLVRFLPALLAIVVFRAGSDDSDRWELYAVPVLVAFGVLRWVTTRYRIADGQIELRRGLFTKQTTTARLDKVRTIDLTAQLHHRALGLAKVEISTAGGQHDRLVLDSLSVDAGRRLRAELLHRVDPAVTGLPSPTGTPVAVDDVPVDAPPPVGDELLVRLDPSWIRYAPLTVTGLASAAAIVGFASQGLSRFSQERSVFRDGASWVARLSWWVDVLLLLGVVSLLAVGAYVLTFWGFRLTRNRLGTLHTRRGLLTNRETSIDAARVRGIRLDEPLGLRLAGARRLKVVTSGLLREQGGSDWLCPPAPAGVVTPLTLRIRPDEAAVSGPLRSHGPAARRRRLTRALVPAGAVAAALVAARLLWDWHGSLLVLVPLLLVGAFALGHDRYRALGHTVTRDHLVSRHGSLDRQRVVLDRDGIIGWKVEQSFFQRRVGVATLVATTAAGAQHYDVVDVPLEQAYAVLAQVSPDLHSDFA